MTFSRLCDELDRLRRGEPTSDPAARELAIKLQGNATLESMRRIERASALLGIFDPV